MPYIIYADLECLVKRIKGYANSHKCAVHKNLQQ